MRMHYSQVVGNSAVPNTYPGGDAQGQPLGLEGIVHGKFLLLPAHLSPNSDDAMGWLPVMP